MEEVKKPRGRQPVPKAEKKVPITVWVKNKFFVRATKDCKKVQAKYDLL